MQAVGKPIFAAAGPAAAFCSTKSSQSGPISLTSGRDAETLDHYLAEAEVPRGTELMRKLGLEPDVRRFDVLDLG